MLKLSKKHTIFRATLIGALIVTVLTAVAYHFINQHEESNAATQDGAEVRIKYVDGDGGKLDYGDDWHTRHYEAVIDEDTPQERTYEAYCAQPKLGNPRGEKDATILPDNQRNGARIKLMIYLLENYPNYEIFNNLGSNWGATSRRKYIFTHAVIGILYDNDASGLKSAMKTKVNNAAATLQTLIDNNSSYWKKAQHYTLYVAKDNTKTQDVVWIEGDFSINTSAVDAEDNDKYVEANNLSHIKDNVTVCAKTNIQYTLKGILMDKETKQPLLVNGQTIETSRPITLSNHCENVELSFDFNTTSIAGKTVVAYQSLYYDDTLITEHTDINDAAQTVDIVSVSTKAIDRIEASDNSQVTDTVSYCVKKGQTYEIKGILMDKETGQELRINGQTVEATSGKFTPTENCGTIVLTFNLNSSTIAGKSLVAFEELWFNNQIIAKHKNLNDPDQTTDVVNINTEAVDDADGDRYLEASENSRVKDIVSYCVQPGQTYIVKGILKDKKTGNDLLIDGKTVEASSEPFTPTESCGVIELLFELDSSKIAGESVVAFETLYLDNTIIARHEDIDDEAQTIDIISIETYAADKETDKKIVPYDSDVTIKDHVKYCLKAGVEYTIKGIVMDKSTKNGLLVNSQLVEQEHTFTPEKNCGELDVFYTFNTTGLGGAELIVFDRIYLDGKLILDHNHFDDASQSFAVEMPVPETGFSTKEAGNGKSSSDMVTIIVAAVAIAPVGVYAFSRRQSRKRFLN